MGAALAVAGCSARSGAPRAAWTPLKAAAPFAVGTCVQAAQLDDPALAALVAGQVSQLTPEWELKMEYVVGPDGAYRFDAPDRIASFCTDHGLRLFGHTLVWYAEKPAAWSQLDGAALRDAFSAYVTQVVGRYRGRAVGWDVVNEAVADDGAGLRSSWWSERLGALDHMRLAFELARAADPDATLFLNDYNLETNPTKRTTFLKLAEALLKAGAPLGGLGTQTHVNADIPPGAIAAALKDLANLGLKVRVSEMDVSLARARGLPSRSLDLLGVQGRTYAEAAYAFAKLPAGQRADFTFWGLEDSQSWLRRESADDAPLLFDDAGRPKPNVAAWEAGVVGARG